MGIALLGVVLVLTLFQPAFQTATTLIALALSVPGSYLWLMRRACYIESRPRLAAAASLVYALLVPAGMYLLTQGDVLTAASGLLFLGVSSFLVAWWLKLRLIHSSSELASQTPPSGSVMPTGSTAGGRWATDRSSWVPTNAVVLALPLWHSLADAGTLRVASTLILPILHVQGALGLLLLPALVRARLSGQLRSSATLAGGLFLALSAMYAPLILFFGSWLAELLFGPQYRIDGATLWLLAAIPLVAAVSGVSGAVLRALERPDQVLWSYVVATGVTCLFGLPLVYRYGVDGALASMLLLPPRADNHNAQKPAWPRHRPKPPLRLQPPGTPTKHSWGFGQRAAPLRRLPGMAHHAVPETALLRALESSVLRVYATTMC